MSNDKLGDKQTLKKQANKVNKSNNQSHETSNSNNQAHEIRELLNLKSKLSIKLASEQTKSANKQANTYIKQTRK